MTIGAPDQQLADLAARHRRGRVVDVRYPSLYVRHWDADRAELRRPVRRERRAQAGELGHAPQLDQRTAEPTLDLLHLRDRHRLAADCAARE